MIAPADSETAVRAGIDVAVPPEQAFAVYTEQFDSWWPRAHHLLDGELKRVGIDPEVGGRLWEETVDGDVCVWGRVLTWDPPRTLAFSWIIQPDWKVPPIDAPASTVTVTFTPTDTGTRVDLVHDNLDAHGEGWESLRDGVGGDGGWRGLLALFAGQISQTAA